MQEENKGASKPKRGRPPKHVDEKLLKELSSILCTQEEMSHILGVSVDTLHNKYDHIIKEAQSEGKCSLRRLQWRIANKGNASMAMFLGKVLLNQREEEFRDNVKFNVTIRQFEKNEKDLEVG